MSIPEIFTFVFDKLQVKEVGVECYSNRDTYRHQSRNMRKAERASSEPPKAREPVAQPNPPVAVAVPMPQQAPPQSASTGKGGGKGLDNARAQGEWTQIPWRNQVHPQPNNIGKGKGGGFQNQGKGKGKGSGRGKGGMGQPVATPPTDANPPAQRAPTGAPQGAAGTPHA